MQAHSHLQAALERSLVGCLMRRGNIQDLFACAIVCSFEAGHLLADVAELTLEIYESA